MDVIRFIDFFHESNGASKSIYAMVRMYLFSAQIKLWNQFTEVPYETYQAKKKIGCALSPLELQIKRSIHDRTEIWFIVSKDTHFLTHFFGAYSKQIHDIT